METPNVVASFCDGGSILSNFWLEELVGRPGLLHREHSQAPPRDPFAFSPRLSTYYRVFGPTLAS